MSGNEIVGVSWTNPIPLVQVDVPAFPTSALTPWLADFVECEALATQTPADLPGMLTLPVCAYAISKRLVVQAREGYIEQLNIFTAVSMSPGNRKSGVFADVIAPLEAFEQDEVRRCGPEIAQAHSEERIAQDVLKGLERKAATAGPDGEAEARREAARLAAEIASHRLPVVPRCVVDDCSPERLTTLLRDQGGRIAVMAAEGDVFDLMKGRYSASGMANFGVFVRGHAGDTLRVDRVGRDADFVPAPALTMGLAVQPDIIQGLMKHEGFRGRGLLGRFLYSIPKSTLGSRDANAPSVPPRVRAAYEAGVAALLRLEADHDEQGDPRPWVLTLDDDARALFLEFQEWLEPMLGEFGELGYMSDWGGKLAGAVLRIVGILCAADRIHMTAPWSSPVERSVVERAIRIGHYLIPHAQAAYGEMGGDPLVADADHLLRWIKQSEVSFFSKREIHQATKGRFKTVASLEPALDLLQDHGYLRERVEAKPPKAGRPASPIYDVNPHTLAHNSHNPQNPVRSSNSEDCEDIEGGHSGRNGTAARVSPSPVIRVGVR